MIYIYRILWLFFYVPVFVAELILCVLGMPFFLIMGMVAFVKYGDVEKTPDWTTPGELAIRVDYWYRGLMDKIEELWK